MSYIEKTVKEALEDYIMGRPVTVLWIGSDGGMNAMTLEDILDQPENRFLVDLPEEPDRTVLPKPEQIVQAVHETQEEAEEETVSPPLSRNNGNGKYRGGSYVGKE